MIKMMYMILSAVMFLLLSSCTTLKDLIDPYESISYGESIESVEEKISGYEQQDEYLRKFQTKDRMGFIHDVTIYDRKYMKIDDVIYAYKFDSLMYYQLSLNLIGDVQGTQKPVGFSGYATPVNNPDTVISFIFARELFRQRLYASKYEACQIDGVYFASPQFDDGYIDDFGCWQRYDWYDYFPLVFKSSGRIEKSKLYMAVCMK